jgi:hypothetical protein
MRYPGRVTVVVLLGLRAGDASAGSHYSDDERLKCSDAVVEVEIPIVKLTASDEERWQRIGRLPRVWKVARKRARLFPIAGPDLKLPEVSSWKDNETGPVPDIVLWEARKRGKLRVLLFLQRNQGAGWRYVLRSANGFPNDGQVNYTETLEAVRRWRPADNSKPAGCGEWG